MSSKKIVVTGCGWVAQFGCDLNKVFDAIYEGKTAIKTTENLQLDGLYCQVSAQVPRDEAHFPFEKWKREVPGNRAAQFIIYGLEAAERSLLDANLISQEGGKVDESLRIGVALGSGIGGLNEHQAAVEAMQQKGANRISPMYIPSLLINLLPGNIAIRHGIKGPNQSQVAACATGAIAIADGARMINEGRCDIMVVGGAEAAISTLGIAGFCALRALASGYNETPHAASRPFDKKRSGFVMGEGAGVLILETEESAKKRGAHIYCEYLGAGLSNDAYHMTAPCSDGAGAAAAMLDALQWAGKKASDINYVNAHATSTGLGDSAEITAIKNVFGEYWETLAVSSIKGSLGHMLGAAGSVEAIISILALCKQKMPPTINLEEPDEACYKDGKLINLVPNKGQEAKIDCVMSTSFGFGGHNVALIFGAYKG